jgi:hypothetical protein
MVHHETTLSFRANAGSACPWKLLGTESKLRSTIKANLLSITQRKTMNIDDLTISQAKELSRMFGGQSTEKPHPFVGEYVILRCCSAGVHAGILVSQQGNEAILSDARRLWSWKAKAGIALSGLSQHGLDSGKVDTRVPRIALTGVIETIPCSMLARESIDGSK